VDRFFGDVPNPLNMLRHEQQSGGIDVPVLDKAQGLLRTSAGIALVHKAALVVHEAV
jgi:hypothetical protein